MRVARSLHQFQEMREQLPGSVGFVPTMGALHEGHLSLMRLAKSKADSVIVTIFVNPTQFAPHEDFDSYPRDVEGDLALLEAEGVDLVFVPREEDIYPSEDSRQWSGAKTNSHFFDRIKAANGLETEFRPHFFEGVVTVVERLFDIVKPEIAIFGEKDYQQLRVIRDLIKDEGFAIEIIAGPIARDEHGLALSSRNAYLSEDELGIARMLNQAIYKAAADIREGYDVKHAVQGTKDTLLKCGFDKVDYVAYRPEWKRVLVAAWLGKTRLIDNCSV